MGKFSFIAALFLLAAASVMAQGIEGVHPGLPPTQIQVGVGVTFASFNEVPGTTQNNFGFNASLVDYHDWLGAEAQVSDAFGSQSGQMSQLLFAGGGVRLRDPNFRTMQPWVHAVVGWTHVSPQLSYGGDQSFGYKVGAGLDINPHHSRIGFRVSADMLGTTFFHTYQESPEFSAGIVLSLGRW